MWVYIFLLTLSREELKYILTRNVCLRKPATFFWVSFIISSSLEFEMFLSRWNLPTSQECKFCPCLDCCFWKSPNRGIFQWKHCKCNLEVQIAYCSLQKSKLPLNNIFPGTLWAASQKAYHTIFDHLNAPSTNYKTLQSATGALVVSVPVAESQEIDTQRSLSFLINSRLDSLSNATVSQSIFKKCFWWRQVLQCPHPICLYCCVVLCRACKSIEDAKLARLNP